MVFLVIEDVNECEAISRHQTVVSHLLCIQCSVVSCVQLFCDDEFMSQHPCLWSEYSILDSCCLQSINGRISSNEDSFQDCFTCVRMFVDIVKCVRMFADVVTYVGIFADFVTWLTIVGQPHSSNS